VYSADKDAVGRSILLARGAYTLGRKPAAAGPLGFDDLAISRSHAVIEPRREGVGWSIADQGSRNGTFVNGARIASTAALADGAVIRAGGTILLFQEVAVKSGEPLELERPPLLGNSLAMQRVRAEIALAAGRLRQSASASSASASAELRRSFPVLILGDSGVGKDLAAQQIHQLSGCAGPWVPVNSSALPENLVESELFGHAAGAYTGAAKRNEGLFMAAHGGTLFLDEIGELPANVQAKLLRALDRGEVRAVGETQVRHADVQVIAATNRDLEAAVKSGHFRGDLYARLAGFVLRIPPFRARREDILGLVRHQLEREGGRPLSADAAEALLLHDWPYNGREIEQVVSSACLRAQRSGAIEVQDLPPQLLGPIAGRLTSPTWTPEEDRSLEALLARDGGPPTREALCQALAQYQGNVAKVAEFFGKDRRQIYRWAERLSIDPESFRSDGG
jgi:transcriptional regulator with GAF, ATPase, and Fis domain